MIRKLKSVINASEFEEDVAKRQALSLRIIIWGGLLITAVAVIGATLIDPNPVIILTGFLAILIYLAGLYLSRKGFVRQASIGLTVQLWLAMTVINWFFGGIKSVSFGSYLMVILIAGVLLGTKSAAIFTMLTILSGGVMVWSEARHWLPEPASPITPAALWIGYSTYAVGLVFMLYAMQRAFSMAIDRRQRMADTLRISEALMQEAQRVAALGSWNWDFASGKVEWSDEMFNITGLGREQLPQSLEAFMANVHTDDRAATQQEIERALKVNGRFDSQYRFIRPDGTIRHLLARGKIIVDEAGQPIRMVGTGLDVTDRVETEQTMQQRIHEISSLHQLGQAINASLSFDEVITAVLKATDHAIHPNMALLYLFQNNQLVLQGIQPDSPEHTANEPQLVLGDCLCGLAAAQKQAILSPNIRTDPRCTQAHCKSAGFTSFAALPLFKNEELLGVLGLAWINPRRLDDSAEFFNALANQIAIGLHSARLLAAEQKRRQEAEIMTEIMTALTTTLDLEKLLRLILDRLNQAIPFDSAAIFLHEGELLTIVAGRGLPTDMAGMQFPANTDLFSAIKSAGRPLILTDATADPRFNQWGDTNYVRGWMGIPLLARGQAIGYMTVDSRKAGAFGPADASLAQAFASQAAQAIENARLYQETKEHAATLETRVAERTQELAAANARLQELDQLKSKFVSDVSHELRTPITNLSLYLDLLERGDASQHERYTAVLKRESTRLGQLVADILNLSNLEQGKNQLAPFQSVQLNEIIERVVAAHQPRAHSAGLELVFTPIDDLPLIDGRPNQINQVLTNLVANAIHYTPKGAIHISAHRDADDYVRLQVEDTGMGIGEADLPYIFDRFYRGQKTGQSTIPGTGLGLAIVQEIVNLHNGRIAVSSNENEGSLFQIWLPIHQPQQGKTNE